jgi:uncharacterized protein YjbI with pentapeptide repeats
MANEEQLELIKQGASAWNKWREEHADIRPDLGGANLRGADLSGADLSWADLTGAHFGDALSRAYLPGANLTGANLPEAQLSEADLTGANLTRANLSEAHLNSALLFKADLTAANLMWANLIGAYLTEADLHDADLIRADLHDADLARAKLIGAKLIGANLRRANLTGADLQEANLQEANLTEANLTEANLTEANLTEADLIRAKLIGAKLIGADLTGARLIGTRLENVNLDGCRIYGVSAWNIKVNQETKQSDLIITQPNEATIRVDNLEVAQFIYLLLHNEKIRGIIDTIGRKGVLLLGRFTNGRIAILERLRQELRKRGFVPMVFNFDKPDTKDFTETVRLLAGLSYFVIVDITNPRSAPLELQATVPECMVPFVPILEKGEEPFAMLSDLWIKHREWVLDPIRYPSLDRLVEVLDAEIVRPAEVRSTELLKRKAEKLRIKDI